MNIKTNEKSAEPSKNLIIHVHGGAFISQTSKAHERYLREWAAKLDVPILSINYSLAPEAPFPRALEEIFYAYCWVLKNPQMVGSTGENIIFVGDSAGGNMSMACIIICITMGFSIPKALVNIYAAYAVNAVVTPSRFLTVIDPLTPYSFMNCSGSAFCNYGDKVDISKLLCSNDIDDFEEHRKKFSHPIVNEKFNFKSYKTSIMSPYLATDAVLREFPPTRIFNCTFDFTLDEAINFSRRLKKLNVDVQVKIFQRLPHAFLHFVKVGGTNYSD